MNTKAVLTPVLLSIVIMAFFSPVLCFPASAAEINCLKCHGKLKQGKSVHKALNMGCTTCHSGIDASTIPHKKTTALAKGLSSEQPSLCYGCHDQSLFTKKTVHAALAMGCTACHNPHSSKNARLLTSVPPALCFTCHDKAEFTKKNVHKPVASGDCMTCHTPHSSDEIALLSRNPLDLCSQCHPDTPHGQHISSRQTGSSEQGTGPQDPARPGKPFYCGSCHNPHSTDSPLLFRFNAQSVSKLCLNCHKMN